MTLSKTDYVSIAEKVMRSMVEDYNTDRRKNPLVTTSKIRRILAMVADIYNDASRFSSEILDEDMMGRLQYLKMHIVYEAGRDKKAVGSFVRKANLLNIIDEIGDSRDNLILFCHYMEALVAYRKYYGASDE